MKLEYTTNNEIIVRDLIISNTSRHFYRHLKFLNAKLTVDGNLVKTYDILKENQTLVIEYEPVKKDKVHLISEKKLDILFENDNYIIIDKPYDLLSIPSSKEPSDSVFNRLLYYFKDTNCYPHITNRLDKETKGLVIVAKNRFACLKLAEVDKRYIAITKTPLKENRGRIVANIIKSDDGIKREVNELGQYAATNYAFLKEDNNLYYYDVWLETGRTHQIRVHFNHLGSPLIGDKIYNPNDTEEELGLICYYVRFKDPFTDEVIEIKSKQI